MTPMKTLLPIPDPNDPKSIESHQQSVLSALAALFDRIDAALRQSVPKANDFFKLFSGPTDLAVHAGITRYLTRLALGAEDIPSEEETASDYELQRVANCGLCLRVPMCEIRILKATPAGIPKANSTARSQFYCSNQLQLLPNGRPNESLALPALSLVVLWDVDSSYAYTGMEIACPRKERTDGSVDCFWIVPWKRTEEVKKMRESGPSNSDLDDIRPKTTDKKQKKSTA